MGFATSIDQTEYPPVTISERIESSELNWILKLNNLEGKSAQIATAISEGRALMVADGSYMAKQSTNLGSAAWMIEDLQTGDSCKGMVRTSGTANEVNAYRSELQGLHAAVASLWVICQHHKVQSGKVTLCCDNKNALWLSSIHSTQVPLRTKHTDLIRAIRKIVLELPIEVVFQDVMGHQDKHVLFEDLDRPSQLNVQVDLEAKRYLRYLLQMDEDGDLEDAPDLILREGWSCWLDQTKVTSDPVNEIIKYVYCRKMKEHCTTKEGLSPEAFDTIDWDAIEDSMDSSPEHFNLWMTKQISGFCPCGKNMKQWGFWEDSKCHSCPEPSEDMDHILYCPHEDQVEASDEAVNGFKAWLVEADTDPAIQYCITQTLQMQDPASLFSAYANAGSTTLSSPTLEASQEQDDIGICHFLKGRVSIKWRANQDNYYKSIGSRRSSRLWAKNLVSNILTLVHLQWKARNAVVHARDDLGLKIREGQELQTAIEKHFQMGTSGLLVIDQHLLTKGRASVDRMTAASQKAWLQNIIIGREIFENEIEMEMTHMRDFMVRWQRDIMEHNN